jgi:hypothetical protein
LGLKGTSYEGSGENYIIRSLMIVLLTTCCSGDTIEYNEMDGACSTYGREEICVHGFGEKTLGKATTWNT